MYLVDFKGAALSFNHNVVLVPPLKQLFRPNDPRQHGVCT